MQQPPLSPSVPTARPTLKAVLFDMDGVLFDSMPIHARTWAETAAKFHLDLSPEEAYLHEGRTGAATIDILARRCWHREATDDEKQQIYAEKCRLFNASEEAPAMPGALQVLEKVRQEGLTIVVVTGSGQQSLLDRLAQNYPGFFSPDLLVSSRDVTHGKPHPEPYLRGLEKAGVTADEALVVENAPLGVRAAVAAGIQTVAVNTGPLSPDTLAAEGAAWVLPSMGELALQFDRIKAHWNHD